MGVVMNNRIVMQTPSHLLITAVINKKYRKPFPIPRQTTALLFGAVLPDIPFFLLTVVYEVYYRWVGTLPVEGSIMEYLHLTLFFTDPIWIISHNFFHSLIINLLLIFVGYLAFRARLRWGAFLFWLAISTQFHTIIDIFTHRSDGPLIFFPLNWTYRFPSPISYWEVGYYGRIFLVFEISLDVVIIGYFVWIWLQKKKHKAAS
jgi:hypothetical protein